MLTPEQVQQYRQKYNVTPISTPDTSSDTLSGTKLLDYLKQKGEQTAQEVQTPEQPKTLGEKIKSGVESVYNASPVLQTKVGVAKSAADSVLGVAELGEKGVRKILGKEGSGAIERFAESNTGDKLTHGQTGFEKFGKTAGDIAQFAAPEALVGKVSNIIKAGETVGNIEKSLKGLGIAENTIAKLTNLGVAGVARIPTILAESGLAAAQNPEEAGKAAGTTAIISAATPPALKLVGKGLKFVGDVGGSVVKNLAAGFGGTKANIIERLVNSDNPESLLNIIKNADFETQRHLNSDTLVKETKDVYKTAINKFGEDLDNLPKRLGKEPKVISTTGKTTIKVNGKTYELSLKGVRSNLTSILKDRGITVSPKGIDFATSNILEDSPEAKQIQKVWNLIKTHKGTTPKDIEYLAQKIGSMKKNGESFVDSNSIITQLKRSTRDYLSERIPEVKTMVDDYRKVMERLDVIDDTIKADKGGMNSLLEKIKTEESLSKLFSNSKSAGRESTISGTLPSAKRVIEEEAAMQSAGGEYTGGGPGEFVAGIGRAITGGLLTPEFITEMALRTGKQKKTIQAIADALGDIEPVKRAIFVKSLEDVFGQ